MRWLIAAGGTGGHVFPALGVARALEDREPGVQVLFVGSRRGLEERVIPSQGFSLRTLAARGLMGLGWRGKLRSLMGLPWTAMQCLSILASFRPHLVLGMGGFVSGPMVLLAALLGLPTAIAEQNAVAGRTNKMLGRFAGRVFLTFPESAQAFPPGKVRLTGNPVRPESEGRRRSPGRRGGWNRAEARPGRREAPDNGPSARKLPPPIGTRRC